MMKRDDGNPNSPIWLVADSNPTKWQDNLHVPLDRRHPSRHNIWTPILEVLQRRLFLDCRIQLAADKFYVRNAVENPRHKSQKDQLAGEVATFRRLLDEHQPLLVLCFGQFAFEFARRAQQEEGDHPLRFWSVERLADQFAQRISAVREGTVNVLPLLHASVARRFLLQCHETFSGNTGNYFDYVGEKLAEVVTEHRTNPKLSAFWL